MSFKIPDNTYLKAALVITMMALMQVSMSSRSAEVPDPYVTVQEATDELIARLAKVKPLYETDRQEFYREVRNSLAPLVDFEGFARGVMAKYYRSATDAQKENFVTKFERQLVETYANALAAFDHQKIEVNQPSQPPEDGRATIDISIHGSSGQVYTVIYSLALLDGNWKLRNVIIDGINIGYQFRSQFSNYMQKYGNDIDQVIANWNVDSVAAS
ncbi:MAG: ABC transporter substrate-binding protein [Pseudomonadales bacterium]